MLIRQNKISPKQTLRAENTKLNSVSFFELIDSAACVNEFLSACEKGVAFAANIHLEGIAFFRGARFERSAASTGNGDLVIIGMYIGLHAFTSLCVILS